MERSKGEWKLNIGAQAFIAFFAGSLFFFLQLGHRADEAEHSHVAWLISQGLQPLHDFFQHHTRLFWDVLSTYFRLGGTGPDVLLFGRLLVVLLGACVATAFLLLARCYYSHREQRSFAAATGVGLYVFLGVSFTEMFVIRPDTLTFATLALAFAVWAMALSQTKHSQKVLAHGLEFLAGALFAVGIIASPRFGLMMLFFPWLERVSGRKPRSLSYLTFGLGSLLVLGLYFGSRPGELSATLFYIRFSALLQKVGDIQSSAASLHYLIPFESVPFLLFSAGTFLLARCLPSQERRRFVGGFGICLLILVLSLVTSWPHIYSQNLMPAVLAYCLLMVLFGARLLPAHRKGAVFALSCLLSLATLASTTKLVRFALNRQDLFSEIKTRRWILRQLRPGERVMLSYNIHPITAPDASYYGGWNVDSENRLCLAVKRANALRKLPVCDYLRDLVLQRPQLVDEQVGFAIPEDRLEMLTIVMRTDYQSLWTKIYPENKNYLAVHTRLTEAEKAERNAQALTQARTGKDIPLPGRKTGAWRRTPRSVASTEKGH